MGLQEYCAGIHEGTVEPCTGLLDAAKRFGWAKALVDFVDRHKFVDFRLVFPTGDGLAVSYPLRLRSQHEPGAARLLTLTRADKEQAKLRLATRCVLHAFHDAFIGKRFQTKELHGSTDEILAKVKTGSFWRTSKPDIIPSPSSEPRRRPATVYGFPEISITSHSDTKTLRRKYHTLRSLVYKEQVDVKAMRQRPRSACSTVRSKQSLSRPKLLETLDFITGVKDAFSVEESGASDVEDNCWRVEDEWVTSQVAPLNFITSRSDRPLHMLLADIVLSLLRRHRFTILQELCCHLGEASEGALFSLHRLARVARARSTDRVSSTWKLPEMETAFQQQYRKRPPDYTSGDEAPKPPPLPRHSMTSQIIKRYESPYYDMHNTPTGITNPTYDVNPRHRVVKRSKSLNRAISITSVDLNNLTLGFRSKNTNDVANVLNGHSGAEFDMRRNYLQKYEGRGGGVDSLRINRIGAD
ncbi:uncharacterized protein LOC126979337 [Leptidea sinapis]|uniref:uncharacterized protein LOC126979337 n=1 Tax=Leptidea sinapis TaxID=189913 RepID=UPI0021C3E817|nr:uncharacterized protein LOC126979337 [Leptidea sinapis]